MIYDPNNYFEYAALPAKELVSSQQYQRDISKKHIKDIMDDFDPYQVNPIKVAYRNGRYYVFDGQHTLSTLVCLFGMDVIVPVMVFKKISYEIEAGLFANQDKHKKKLTKEQILLAMYENKNEKVIQFKKCCESYGFDCDFMPSVKDKKISSYSYLYDKVFCKNGVARLEKVLRVCTKAYGVNGTATNSYVLKAVNCLFDHYELSKNPCLRETVLVKALSSTKPADIRDNGNKDTTRKGEERYAAQLVVAYNAKCGRKTTDRLDTKFVS